ncbi:MAG TPA: FlgD immunoglobulin-like domain containing protein [Solirubrobacteraceae bacterium]|nr:FlgD immunoglobulin-like domain containing protein [Solirubrobacteraceae bacterium]
MSLFARAAFILLVVASFAAFFVAQRLKSAPQVARITGVTQQFSPNGDGSRDVARIRLKIARDDDVTVTMVDAAGSQVRRIATALQVRKDVPVTVEWDGEDDAGATVPDGFYNVRVSLRSGGRAATLYPRLSVDTQAPRPTVLVGDRWITGPEAAAVAFRLLVVSERTPTRMQVLRTDGDVPEVVARFELPPGVRSGSWDGLADGAPAPPGTYQIVSAVRDSAGNVGRSAPPVDGGEPVRGTPGVSVRKLIAQPPADPVRAGEQGQFAVDSRGRPFKWSMRRIGERAPRREGERASGGPFKLKVPDGPSGLYEFSVRIGSNRTSVPFAVQAEETAPILVVLPFITWYGSDGLDDDRDGIPNTLARDRPVAYPKLMQQGLPERFTEDTAALLAFLDRQDVRYDVTTDLALAASRRGLSDERPGVLLAGPVRWIPTELARRLRRYAAAGGRVASFGTDALRRGVDVARDRLLRPLPPAAEDSFGAEIADARELGPGQPLEPIADEGDTGLLTGVSTLPGFSAVEESTLDSRVRAALAAVDEQALEEAEERGEEPPETRPALTLSAVGDGTVIRVGLPEWGAKLQSRSVPVQQLTRNITDILRGAEPKIRSFPR